LLILFIAVDKLVIGSTIIVMTFLIRILSVTEQYFCQILINEYCDQNVLKNSEELSKFFLIECYYLNQFELKTTVLNAYKIYFLSIFKQNFINFLSLKTSSSLHFFNGSERSPPPMQD